MNDTSLQALQTLVRTTCGVTLAVCGAWLLLRWFRAKTGRLHRAVWLAVLLQGWAFWTISLPVLPQTEPQVPSEPSGPSGPTEPWSADSNMTPVGRSLPTDFRAELEFITTETVDSRGGGALVSRPLETANRPTVAPLAFILLIVWLGGIGFIAARFAWRYVRFVRRVSRSMPPEPEWEAEWQSIKDEFGIQSRIPLRVISCGPSLCRLPRGYCVLIPGETWQSLSSVQRRSILLHELHHYRHGDVWKSLLIRLLALPHWFNPLVWLAVRRFEECAEWACDDVVRQDSPQSVTQYAHTLLDLTNRPSGNVVYRPAASGRFLSVRIRRLLNPLSMEDSLMKRMSLLSLVTGLSLLGVFRVVASDRKPHTFPANEAPARSEELAKTAPDRSKAHRRNTPDVQADKAPASSRRRTARRRRKNDEAVINVSHIFKQLDEFRDLRNQLKEKLRAAESRMNKLRQEIKRLQKNRNANADQQKQVERLRAEYIAKRKTQTRKFIKREAEVYHGIYSKMRREVARYARKNGIRVVRQTKLPRKGAKPLDAKTILQSLNREIVYLAGEENDITDVILERLQTASRKGKNTERD